MKRKRKMQRTGSQGSNTRFCVGSSSQGRIFRPGQQSGQSRMQTADQGFQTPQQQTHHNNFQSPHSAPSPSQKNNVGHSTVAWGPCFNYG
jgi:hypothetical protein